ncbi:ankyrin repeat protein [Ectocarpus siliculosus]|uniref:Ankyrin repeat protein n=1 Tax=Ectocarpus siliculosus TaxID=2880 RepID=D7G751_ECTSI|nr:ankyrin repeat protein [Ectocarpus siliculosus]|eukprot:CBJ25744.1 ankyrin repeat protein [Ectocarpus siliculosus]
MASQGQQQQQQRVSESSNQLSCRSNLRGTEKTIFDLVCAGTNRRQWAEWLRTPLEHAAGVGNIDLVTKLQGAGAGGSALHLALRAGQDALAQELLRLGAPTKAKDNNGDTPLHLAAASGLGDVVSLLLRDGAEVDVLDNKGRTSIHLSAERGSPSTVQALLAAGGDPSLRYGKGKAFSALGLAARGGHVEVMQALIRHGVDVDGPDSNGCTALHSAAIGDAVGAIDVLIEAGASIDAQGGEDGARYTPLHVASEQGSSEAALSLVKHGADVHRSGKTCRRRRCNALNLAAGRGHTMIVTSLLAAGVNVNLRPAYSDKSALDAAFQGGHADIVTSLIQHGAFVDATDSRGCTALFKVSHNTNAALIDKLVAAGASVNGIVDATGRTPLHHACMNDCPEAIISMLRHGARVDAKDDDGDTPLHVASTEGCSEGIRALVQHGADIKALNAKGRTPLALTAEFGCEDATVVLLDAGADVNAPADHTDGSAALSLATLSEYVDDTMKILIQHGADVNARNTDGFTALHRAAMYNEVDGVDLLISAGAIIEALDNHKSTPLAVAFREAVYRWKKYNGGAGDFAAMVSLLKHGADPNIGNIQEGCPNSLLWYFIRCGCPISVFRELLAVGPNLDVRDDEGCTLLLLSQDHPELFSELLLHGADTNVQTKRGKTALHKAAQDDNGVCIEALISAGASTNVKDRNGRTPLHLATINHKWNAMRMLLRSGADISSADNDGFSALHLAAAHDQCTSGDSAMATTMDLLLRWGADENAVDSAGRTPVTVWRENESMYTLSWANKQSVKKMFQRAPRDKAWRRRGWLVLCRAFPNRVRLKEDNAGTCPRAGRSLRARRVGAGSGSGSSSVPPVGEAGGVPVGTLPPEKMAGGLSALVAKVVGLHEDGVFMTIMEFV